MEEAVSEHQVRSDDVTFDHAIGLARRWLMGLICAIGTARYFDSWLAAVQLRVALDRAERLASLMANEFRASASRRFRGVQSLAAPMLALAPAPSRLEICKLRTLDADADRCAWNDAEHQWRRSILQVRFNSTMHVAQYSN